VQRSVRVVRHAVARGAGKPFKCGTQRCAIELGRHPGCLGLALSGHARRVARCPLIGVKRIHGGPFECLLRSDSVIRRCRLNVRFAPPKADLNASSRHVAQVPKAAVSRRSNRCSYSITSSAVASNLSGTVRPSILAVEALMTSSNLLDCTTGKSAGFAPLRIWPV
jgi:hypothetical protein